jgi:hypothetical protein
LERIRRINGCNHRWFRPWHDQWQVNAYTKVAQATIRLIAFALVVISLLLYVDDLSRMFKFGDNYGSLFVVVHVHTLVLKAIPFLVGLILFWKSRALAERLTKDLD